MGDRGFLRRYTSLASAIDLLWERRLTLLSPSSWDDGNDRHYLERYLKAKGEGSVLALCFARTRETYHHWRVFTSGTEGVCIEFDSQRLIESLPTNVSHGEVKYVKIRDISNYVDDVERWPFLKRYPYEDEQEYRLIWYVPEPDELARHFPVDLSIVDRVTTSPWLPGALHQSVSSILRSIPGCGDLDVHRTTLIDNERWQKALPTRRA